MLTIYLLIISLGIGNCDSRVCPASTPFVSFYRSEKSAVKERDALMTKHDSAKLYKMEFRRIPHYNIFSPEGEEVEPIVRYVRVKELKTVPVQTYEVTETSVTISQ